MNKLDKFKTAFSELRGFTFLWLTQALSGLGSSMTSFALILWTYGQEGSAMSAALLSVCSDAPYVLVSVFAGAISDKWNKKITMLVCDAFAAVSTVITLILLMTGNLRVWHLYLLNAVNGLMNSVQQPASDVAVSLLIPQKYYQQAAGMRVFSNSVINILTPAAASAVMSAFGINAVFAVDLATFFIAFISLLFFIRIPEKQSKHRSSESMTALAKEVFAFFKDNKGIFGLIMFLAAINLTASICNAALPALIIPKASDTAYAIFSSVQGIAMLVGSVAASLVPAPKNRIRAIFISLFISMSTENFMLAFGRSLPVWCIGVTLGWLLIPLMNTNLDVVIRTHTPIEMQGRVYAARNSFQFFTIPIGYMLGGALIDKVFEPFMLNIPDNSILHTLFGIGKGSGAAFLFLVIAFLGIFTCVFFAFDKNIWALAKDK